MRQLALLAVFWLLNIHYFSELAYSQGSPKSVRRLHLSLIESSSANWKFKISLNTAEGLHRLLLGKSKNLSLYGDNYIPLRGKRLSSLAINTKSSKQSAGGLISSELNIIFYGKRRGRLFELTIPPKSKSKGLDLSKARLKHLPSSFSLPCALQQNQVLAAADSTFNTSALELASPAAVYSPLRYIEIATDADFEFYNIYSSRTDAVIRNILNIAEAIYIEQLGFGFQLVKQSEFKSNKQPYLSNDSLSLLQEFQEYSEQHGQLGASDIKHLFTNKNITNGVIGLAYVGAACEDPSYSYGLTKKVSSSIQALVTAHEIGHSLGATHPENTFPFAPPSLMTSLVKAENNRFSNFSLTEISQHIDESDPSKICLSESKSPRVDLKTNFSSANSSSKLQFNAEISSNNLAEEPCTMSLYASTKGRLLDQDNLLSGENSPLLRIIYQKPARRKIKLRSSFRKGRFSMQKRVFFRAFLNCANSNTRAFSETEVQLLNAYNSKGRVRNILDLLSTSLEK